MTKKATTGADLTAAAVEALLAKHDGRISPQILLDEARDPASPFHDKFLWDDDEAAEQYRLMQASAMIRRWKGAIIRVNTQTRVVQVTPTRRVQSPENQRGKGQASYETTEQIMADPNKRESLIQTVLAELQAYRKRYAELVALSAVWAAIDEAIDLHGSKPQPPLGDEARPPA
jgi:hypothetical protein